jgi:diguanylate cyclase (GGDEF)-like protein
LLLVILAPWLVSADTAPPPAHSLSVPDHPRYAIQHVGEAIGLGTASVTSLVQDRQGFMWVGTQTGLYRFDGMKAQNFGHGEGMLDDLVEQLFESPDGTLWAVVGLNIYRFDGFRFSAVALPQGVEVRGLPQTLAVLPGGEAYVATESGLLLLQTGARSGDTPASHLWSTSSGRPLSHVTAVAPGPDGSIWFGAEGHLGILRPGAQEPKMFSIQGLPAEELVAITTDGLGRVWLRTHNHVGYLTPALTEYVPADEGVPVALNFGLPAVDRSGNLLLPTVRGLYRRNGNSWVAVNERQGLSTSGVYTALEDRENAIWVGLAGTGMDRWAGSENWFGWGEMEGLPDPVVWCVIRDAQQRLWVGTNNGLAMWDSGAHRWRIWQEKQGIAGITVSQLALAGDGSIWALSLHGGLTRIDPHTLTATKVKLPESGDKAPLALAVRPDGTLWISARTVLYSVRAGAGSPAMQEMPLPEEIQRKTRAISFAPDGTLWAGGPTGLARFDGSQWRVFTKAEGLRDDQVELLLALSHDEVWLCYRESEGLTHARVEGEKLSVRHFTVQQGLRSDSVYLLGRDYQGRIWAGGDRGIDLLSDESVITHFDHATGLLWDDLGEGYTWNDPDGSVFIATSRGLARYLPGGAMATRNPPAVVLTSAELGGTQYLNQTDVEVSHDSDTFVADFAVMTFHSPENIRCQYRLQGLETEFLETSQREVRYPALPPGQYRFDVRCGSVVSGWSAAPASFSFSISPPWWARWWARLGALLLLGLTVRAAVIYRIRRLEGDRLMLEQAVAERSAELARANAELQAMSLADPLTKVRNRRFFRETIEADAMQVVRAYRRAGLNAGPIDHGDMIFYFVDLDHFKRVNDEHGHYAGDRVLVECARRLNSIVRQSDLLIRWGGEEFLVVLRAGTRADGDILARRLLRLIGEEAFDIGDGKMIPLTCSIGWAAFPWITAQPDALSVDDVLVLADRSMYAAKEAGRNYAVGIAPGAELLRETSMGAAPRVDLLVPESALVRLTRSLGSWIQAPTAAAQNKETEGHT